MKRAIGIDPGESGSIVAIGVGGISMMRLSETEHDIAEFLKGFDADCCFAVLEKVHAMPKQGVCSAFSFGASYGFLKGLLVGLRMPFEEVSPQAWQKTMGCRTGGDKNISKAAAQRLFPSLKVVHANADALLIAEYCRRLLVSRGMESNE